MNGALRFALFLSVVLGTWTAMHLYLLHRVWRLPPLAAAPTRRWAVLFLVVLWALYPVGRILARLLPGPAAYSMEFAGAVWMGVLFLSMACLLAADLLTGFGAWLRPWTPNLRLGALAVAGVLSALALVQGLRSPEVVRRTIGLPGLPLSLRGTRVVQVSDLHLGTLLGRRWLRRLAGQVEALDPHVIVVTGDLVDGHLPDVESLRPLLGEWKAPFGKWAVLGNHEYYAGPDRSADFLASSGLAVLRQEAAEAAPGLWIAGVDDLTARRQFGLAGDPVAKALGAPRPGALILLSHSPLGAEEASSLGAGLMLSGHTHGGQIWPFGMLVRLAYPRLQGTYRVGSMTLVVSRGTGTWGPPMRLFRRGEIGILTLEPVRGNP
ncbi:MAG: metallophosphoesterase [Acidobacteriota bacterium]